MKLDYSEKILHLTQEISSDSTNFKLYYNRGLFYFLSGQDDLARVDYNNAVKLGLDCTEIPYYAFSNDNSIRRDFLLPEKILVFLILLIVLFSLLWEVFSFFNKHIL